jgi:pyruvate/2-oxoglutarate/acetoin dehydrogenase E1 component
MFQRADRANGSKAAIKEPPRSYHRTRGPVVTSDTIQPIEGTELRKPGTDAVIITWGTVARVAPGAAQPLESEGLQVGVLDLGWLAPLDEETIRSAATRANGKVVVAHEANVTGGFGAKIVARLHELSENGAPITAMVFMLFLYALLNRRDWGPLGQERIFRV